MKFRLLILAVSLLVFGMIAALYVAGTHNSNLNILYQQIMALWGLDVKFKPYQPFVDLHFILAALQCDRLGWDVFVANPCDALGRHFIYSPFWMISAPIGLSPNDTVWLGTTLVFVFLCAVAWISISHRVASSRLLPEKCLNTDSEKPKTLHYLETTVRIVSRV